MHFLGLDIGSSSVKASLLDAEAGTLLSSAFYPAEEMKINAVQSGWAEQDPELWYENLKVAVRESLHKADINSDDIQAIGISYQMHGLVAVDDEMKVVRPSIIWCDSRAVEIGEKAFKEIGESYCLNNLLNSPGNFTASKLAWVKDNEPGNYRRINKVMLPGDYIAMKLTGEAYTTMQGLTEGIFWDFKEEGISSQLLDYFEFDLSIIPDLTGSFGVQGRLLKSVAEEIGLKPGIPVTYRAGDQPNNAFSLNVLNPGEVAATAGTSAVLYAVTNRYQYDPDSRVNIFAHVNHLPEKKRLGVLACINGAGIMNAWVRRNFGKEISYSEMNKRAHSVKPGSEGLKIYPFGNGAERVLGNRETGAMIQNLNLNIHSGNHLFRAVQEGIAYGIRIGFDIMKEMGMEINTIRAGEANMFLSPLFRQLTADLTGAPVSVYNVDGALGAARGAALGAGYYSSPEETFDRMKVIDVTEPVPANVRLYKSLYEEWKYILDTQQQ